MITVNGHRLVPTIFPDRTSQVWKLPQDIIQADELRVKWSFEEEREIIDLLSLRQLNKSARLILYMPYLPYARQDKEIANDATFNLRVFAELVGLLKPNTVWALDAHNREMSRHLFGPPTHFVDASPKEYHKDVCEKLRTQVVVYPDFGAQKRYGHHLYRIPQPEADGKPVCIKSVELWKTRDPGTGGLTGHRIQRATKGVEDCKRFLIVDDICDGGATFLSVAEILRKEYGSDIDISLFVTHGLFSKGREHLTKAGIRLFTTNSLIHNDGIEGVYNV